jgi:hypothetical protein
MMKKVASGHSLWIHLAVLAAYVLITALIQMIPLTGFLRLTAQILRFLIVAGALRVILPSDALPKTRIHLHAGEIYRVMTLGAMLSGPALLLFAAETGVLRMLRLNPLILSGDLPRMMPFLLLSTGEAVVVEMLVRRGGITGTETSRRAMRLVSYGVMGPGTPVFNLLFGLVADRLEVLTGGFTGPLLLHVVLRSTLSMEWTSGLIAMAQRGSQLLSIVLVAMSFGAVAALRTVHRMTWSRESVKVSPLRIRGLMGKMLLLCGACVLLAILSAEVVPG